MKRFLTIALLIPLCGIHAQDFSGLEGKELTRVEDMEIAGANLLWEALGPGRGLSGSRIERIVVREDRERRLVLVVFVTGLPREAGLQLTVLDQARRPQRWVGNPRVTPDSAATQVEVTIDLDERAPEGTSFESTYLRLGINKRRASVGKEFLFLLPKKWQLAIRPENTIVLVRPAPIGRARDAAAVNRYRLDPAGSTPPPEPHPQPGRLVARPVGMRRMEMRAAAVEPELQTRPFSLTDEFGNRFALDVRPAAAGKIVVEATWSQPAALAIILNGPGQTGYYARQDGNSPLRLEFDLTAELFAKGEGWRLSLVNFSRAPANGSLRVSYPTGTGTVQSAISPTRIRIAPSIAIRPTAVFTTGLTAAQRDSGMSGPGNETIDLLGSLRSDVNFDVHRVSEMLGISGRLYKDRNPAAGTFYFLPRAYHLRWDPSARYGMSILYRTDGPDTNTAQVQMSAHLDAGIGTNDLNIAALLLQTYVRRNNQAATELRLQRMPLDAAPRLSFSDNLHRLYDVPVDRVVIREISDALAEVRVDWVTDARTATDMQTELLARGLSGQAVLDPQGQVVSSQAIPVEISLRDPATYGLLNWRRGELWRNETHYPITIQRLHALMLDVQDGIPTVLSWALGDSVLPPQARLRVDTATVPTWVDANALRLWIEYAVAQRCETCDRRALADIRGGASFAERQAITFTMLTPLASIAGSAAITVQVRSRYLRPDGNGMQEAAPLTLSADSRDFPATTIYPPAVEDSAAMPGPFFEYRLNVVMSDGTEHTGTTWIPSSSLTVFIGTVQVRQSLGFLPGTSPE